MDKKLSKKALLGIIIGVVAVLAIIIAIIFANRNKLTAIVMRLIHREGEVTLLDASGQDVSILENMKLFSGNALVTGGDGLVDLSLDDTKFITIEHTSNVEFQKDGKALELKLKEGRLFFNVTEKLADDESMDISTSNMVVGIRGTSGWVDADNSDVYIGDGTVHVTGINPETGDTVEADLTAGQKAHVYLVEQDGKTVAFEIKSYTVQEIPREMLRNIVTTPELFKRILEETDFSAKEIIREAIIKKILPEEMVLDEDMQKVLEEVLKEMEEPEEEEEVEVAGEPEEEKPTQTTTTRRQTTQPATVAAEPVETPAAQPAASTPTYTVTVASATGGTASASATSAAAGTQITLTATADYGYEFAGWTSSEVTVSNNSFSMPASNVTVTATFNALPTRNVTVHWYTGSNTYNWGSASITSPTTTATSGADSYYSSTTIAAVVGDTVTVTASPLQGYRFSQWLSGGVEPGSNGAATLSSDNPYSFTVGDSDMDVYADFQPESSTTFALNIAETYYEVRRDGRIQHNGGSIVLAQGQSFEISVTVVDNSAGGASVKVKDGNNTIDDCVTNLGSGQYRITAPSGHTNVTLNVTPAS